MLNQSNPAQQTLTGAAAFANQVLAQVAEENPAMASAIVQAKKAGGTLEVRVRDLTTRPIVVLVCVMPDGEVREIGHSDLTRVLPTLN
jgi:hypothetical protein